jgi:hypothetical protein
VRAGHETPAPAVDDVSTARRREPGAQLTGGRTVDAFPGVDREHAPELVGAGAREAAERRVGEAFDAETVVAVGVRPAQRERRHP